MTSLSCGVGVSTFACPTKWQLWRQVLALLPRGRSFQTHELVHDFASGPNSQVGTFEANITGLGSEPNLERLTIQQRYWAAFAEVLAYLHARACALIEEMFCDTIAELQAEWWAEYGFPDACEPWHALCDKVRATGGSTCGYFQEIAAALGWIITCGDCQPGRGATAGCAAAGCSKTCGCPSNTMWITVHLADSPAYTAPVVTVAGAGRARAGAAIASNCPPQIDPLICLIERFKPAHVKAVYILEGP